MTTYSQSYNQMSNQHNATMNIIIDTIDQCNIGEDTLKYKIEKLIFEVVICN